MIIPMATITWRVSELAARRGWGARQLAEAAGLDEKTVRNILAGRATRVDLETIARLSTSLEVAPGALWMSRPNPAQAWVNTAGSAGQAEPGEFEAILSDHRSEYVDSGLERALRSP
jgi:DNA-binding Xre family transcriptional regulator